MRRQAAACAAALLLVAAVVQQGRGKSADELAQADSRGSWARDHSADPSECRTAWRAFPLAPRDARTRDSGECTDCA
jgi:hypothetical protein